MYKERPSFAALPLSPLPSIIKIFKKSENGKSGKSTISLNGPFSLRTAIFFCLSHIASTIRINVTASSKFCKVELCEVELHRAKLLD